jgi:1-acyl-sn-glycerol-3-phosphate acyltransferase
MLSRFPRACWRLLRLLIHIARGLWIVTLRFPRLSPQRRQAHVQAWALGLLACVGVTLAVRGSPPRAGPALLVANHLSWLDIPAMHAARYCRFISKSDVRGWPIVGPLATAAGTLYIERASRRDALRMVRSMHEALLRGEVLAVFPEGTTGDGCALLPFHANLLQAALTAGAPAQPVGLCFVERASGAVSHAPGYIGEQTLAGSIWRTLMAPPLTAVVRFGEVQQAGERNRHAWSRDLHAEVDALRRP